MGDISERATGDIAPTLERALTLIGLLKARPGRLQLHHKAISTVWVLFRRTVGDPRGSHLPVAFLPRTAWEAGQL